MIDTKLYEFNHFYVEKVYVSVDIPNHTMIFAIVNMTYTMTLNIKCNLKKQLEDLTTIGDVHFNEIIRDHFSYIIDDLFKDVTT